MKKYYVAQYKNTGDDRFLVNDILNGNETNMRRWANKTVLELGYSSMHECEEDAETEIAILRVDFLRRSNKLHLKQYKDEVKSLSDWLNFYKGIKPHLFV